MHWFVTVSRGFGTPRGTISPRRQVTEGTITPVRMEGTLPHMAGFTGGAAPQGLWGRYQCIGL